MDAKCKANPKYLLNLCQQKSLAKTIALRVSALLATYNLFGIVFSLINDTDIDNFSSQKRFCFGSTIK